jgi:hypothetical protein
LKEGLDDSWTNGEHTVILRQLLIITKDIPVTEFSTEKLKDISLHANNPDFKIENTYIEIKGYDSDVWQNKLKQFPHKLDILYENGMEPIFKYVHSKYGKKFVRLYESQDLNIK